MAAEREARLFAAWREQVVPPQAQPPMPTTEAVAAIIPWQARQAEADKGNKGKGKQMAAPPLPPGVGNEGQGQGLGRRPPAPAAAERGARDFPRAPQGLCQAKPAGPRRVGARPAPPLQEMRGLVRLPRGP